MANWNLNVELRGQGSDLVRTLRDASREANTLARNARRAQQRLDGLRDAARDAAQSLGRLQRNLRQTADGFGDLRTQALAAATSMRSVNTAAGRADSRLETVSQRSRTLTADLDALGTAAGGAGEGLAGLRGRVGGVGQAAQRAAGDARELKRVLALLATAAGPVAASVVPLAASAGAAGVAFGAFAAALGGQVSALSDAAEAQTKYEEAIRDNGAHSQEAAEAAAELQKKMAALPPATQEAAAAIGSMRDQWQNWSDSVSGDTMPVLTKSVQTLSATFPKLTPMVRGTATEMDRLVTLIAGGISTGAFDELMDTFNAFSTGALRDVTNGMVHLLRTLDTGEVGGGVQEFMAFAREVGPQVADTLSELVRAMAHIAAASQEAGVTVLTVVNAFARLVNAIPTEVLSTLLQLAIVFKAVKLAAAGLGAGGAMVAAFTGQLTAMRTAAAGAVGPMAAATAGFGALSRGAKLALVGSGIGLLVVALSSLSEIGKTVPPDVDKLTTSLSELAKTGKLAGEAARVFGKDLSGLSDAVRTLSRPSNLDSVQQFLTRLVGMDSTPVAEAKETIDGLDKALAGLVRNGRPELAAAALERVASGMKGLRPEELRSRLDDYKSALADARFEQELAAQSMGLFGQQALATGAKLDAQKASADGLRQSISALNETARSALDAQAAFEQAIDDAAAAVQKHAGALSMTNGRLNLGTQAAREAYQPLSELAAKTDEVAAAARENGASWSQVQGIYNRGRTEFIQTADALGLTRSQAVALADQLLQPMHIDVGGANEARLDLEMVQNALRGTKSKTVTVSALTKAGQQALEELGFKIKRTKGKTVHITIPTGTAKSAINTIQGYINGVTGKTVGIGVYKTEYYQKVMKPPKMLARADGGIVEQYADGGVRSGRERHIAQIARAGTYRVWAEDETGGEAYIPLAASKRPRSRAITEETVRRLGGDPDSIHWFANGGLDFSYRSSGGQANKYTLSGLVSASNDKRGNFSLSIFTSKLRTANNYLDAWREDLATVAERAGQDVADALAEMGDEGIALTKKMAHGSSGYIKSMAKELRNLASAAKASLGEYTSQLKDAVQDRAAFQADLAKLAGMGYGALAGRLAGQNDADAAALAAQAARDPKKAAAANSAAAAADKALDGEQLAQLVQIIAAVKTQSTGLHDVAAATGLGEDEIIATAGKAQAQIASSLGSRATRFLTDLGRAQKGLAYADGGIRAGIYATRGGLVRFAEPETGGEAYIPLGANKRRNAMSVLGDVASRFGVGLGDAASPRVVIVREKAPMVGATHFHIGDRKSDRDLARDIESRQTYQLRRLARGGAR